MITLFTITKSIDNQYLEITLYHYEVLIFFVVISVNDVSILAKLKKAIYTANTILIQQFYS